MSVKASSRRGLMTGAACWAAGALAALRPVRSVAAVPTFLNDPFQIGVASGDPVADGFIIWTRLIPDLFDPRALPPEAIPVAWEVATDDKFRKIAASGQTLAHPDLGHSVHVDVRGLDHGRPYFYRFRCGPAVSRTGRAQTLATPRTPLDRMRFAFASCQHFEQGYFTAYRDMIAQDPDLIIHLGDYIYEISWGTSVRHGPVAEARTLAEYRLTHALYKSDPDLQAAHAHCPWIVTWDDHEVANDYSRQESERDRDPATFLARRRAAYQAYYEHMPLRPIAAPTANGDMTIFQRLNAGDLLEIALLDLRTYRDAVPCQTPDWYAGRVVDVSQCAEIGDPARTMLGRLQERWLSANMGKSGARWHVIAQSLMLASFDQMPGPARGVYTDNWGGYAGARQRVLDMVKARRDAGVPNFVSIGGDIHSFFVSDIKVDDRDPNSETLMTEFITSSITSESYNTAVFNALLPENPHIKLIDDRMRGYVFCDVTPETWRTTLRVVDNVRLKTPTFQTLASFVVESGRPGAQTA